MPGYSRGAVRHRLEILLPVMMVCLCCLVASQVEAAFPATGPGALPDDDLHLTFDGKPGPFTPQREGQRVEVEAWFLGRRVPLDKCKIRFPGDWASLELAPDGTRGWLTVKKIDVSGHDLGPENRYVYTIELKLRRREETRRGVSLKLDCPYRLHRLDATIVLSSGKVKPFDLRRHPDIYPVSPKDVFVWPSDCEVLLFRNALWVGTKTREEVWCEGKRLPEAPGAVVLVAVRLRLKSGGTRWIYTNILPETVKHRGWDDESSRLRLPVFPGSAEVYRKAAAYFRSKGVPFQGLSDISHVRGEKTGR